MWQAINYQAAMFRSNGTTNGMFGTAPGNITAGSPLKPFYDGNLTLYTSNSVTNTRVFGYTYPEIDDWSKTSEELATYVRTQVNILYDRTSDVSPPQRRNIGTRSAYPGPPQDRRWYYAAEVQVNRSNIPLPSTVNIVLNGSVIGRMALLSMPSTGIASANLPLRDLKKGGQGLEGMDPDEALKFLEQAIEVEIRLVCGPSHQTGRFLLLTCQSAIEQRHTDPSRRGCELDA